MNTIKTPVPADLSGDLIRLCQWEVLERAYLGTMAHQEADPENETGLLEIDDQDGNDSFETAMKVVMPGAAVRSRPTTQALRLVRSEDEITFRARALQIYPGEREANDFIIREIGPLSYYGNLEIVLVSGEWFAQPLFMTKRVAGRLAIFGKLELSNAPEIVRMESAKSINPEEGLDLISKLAKKLLEISNA